MGLEKLGALGFWGGAEEGGKLGAESNVGAPTDMPGGDPNPRHAMRQCTELKLGHTARDQHGGPGV